MNGNVINAKEEKHAQRTELALRNNSARLETLRHSKSFQLACFTNKELRRKYYDYLDASDSEHKLDLSGEVMDLFDQNFFKKQYLLGLCLQEDLRLMRGRIGREKVIDNSGSKVKDYYSVAVIVKNEARFMREFILFYQATGADRIYIYDNGSTDNLLEILEPFLEAGQVIYISWPGNTVQTAAYRDAVRRTKHRTKWLALIDADEFLFSPKGKMPDILKGYEQYPGVGVNWMLFGPNGHDRRPEGLVMDNYTTTFADNDAIENCTIKSIVQPQCVLMINQPHYAIYKGNRLAVDETGEKIGRRNAFKGTSGRAFTACNRNEVFRINHYRTKSLEDLEAKCMRGFPDGTPAAVYEKQIKTFDVPLTEDLTIKPYADIVRERMKEY